MKPVIIGCRTENFTDEQLAVFKKHQPLGMIVFAEPCNLALNLLARLPVKRLVEAVGQRTGPCLGISNSFEAHRDVLERERNPDSAIIDHAVK